MKHIIKIIFIFFIIFSCKSNNQKLNDLSFVEEKIEYDKYKDSYKDFTYENKSLGFTMSFDKDWVITTEFRNFDSDQKKYATYFATPTNEILFFGYNEEKKIGIRAIKEELGLANDDYFSKIKESNSSDVNNYGIRFPKSQKVVLKNIQGLNFVFETTINAKNVFVFDSIIFKNKNSNFRVDMWTKKSNYETVSSYIATLYQTIDFVITEIDSSKKTD
ncbi:MAG: hypothetical protein A2086_10570 [Spirochaetes bacterium GWD1_27_9]|nr:MAG: hypothetical protein A2Z98_17805 [Spirochaetes bacterium GWB1_27_13]OHD30920.1 MAG: hypothetical protein A2086_10570 [Spirochaetes bacterium GWD1_27_9]